MGAPSARVFELSAQWAKLGHDVTVLTGFPNHPTGTVPPEYRSRFRRLTCRDNIAGIKVIRTWLYPAPNRLPLERILNYSSFFVSAVVRSLPMQRFDLVIATSPQLLVGLCGWWIGKLKRCPFIFEVRDLWPESLLASGVSHQGSALIQTLERLTMFLYRRSDRIVVVTEAFKRNLISVRGISPEKIDVVTNGADLDLFCTGQSRESIRAALDLENRFVISYVGTIGFAHGLETLLDAARKIQAQLPHVLFLIVGDGADRKRLEDLASEWQLPNVRFLGQQPREKVPGILSASDLCVVMLRKSELFKTVLPSKMFEIFAAACPVILTVDGEARSVLEKAKAGIYVEAENVEALVEAILRVCNNPSERSTYAINGRDFVSKSFSREQTALNYLSILQSTAQSL